MSEKELTHAEIVNKFSKMASDVDNADRLAALEKRVEVLESNQSIKIMGLLNNEKIYDKDLRAKDSRIAELEGALSGLLGELKSLRSPECRCDKCLEYDKAKRVLEGK